jgi:hypothetical protein
MKTVKPFAFRIDSISRRIVFFTVLLIVVALHWYIAKWAFANMVSSRADRPEIADIAVNLAPDDPQTHYAAAVLYDKTFLPQDQAHSLSEYEWAVSRAPENYLLWLEYGKALARGGDSDKAEAALRHAEMLAPNYSIVHWTLGNAFVREGKLDEGFAEIGRAVESDPSYASPAVAIAYALYEGDLSQIRRVVGESPGAKGALALTLARARRYDDAVEVWNSIPPAGIDNSLSEVRRSLSSELLSAKKFLLTEAVSRNGNSGGPAPGQIYDGGFEQGIKVDNAAVFEWQITQGSQPQVVQNTRQPHSGAKSLVLLFNSNDGNGLRQLSQIIAIRTGAKYSFSGYYHSDLKSASPLVWQIVNASNNMVIAELPLRGPAADWTPFSITFAVPADTDGIIVRLSRAGCGSSICPISGSVWLDDLSLLPL